VQAYDGYFQGRPKVDTIRIRLFADQQTLFSNLLAGVVDVFPENVLNPELTAQLQQHWQSTNGGSVYIKEVTTRFLAVQWRPALQWEPANFDTRVRAALYRALDRETLADVLQTGHREMAAYAILPPHDPLFSATKDALRTYSYDPDRAKAELRELGWLPGSDGVLHNSADGRPFRTAITASTSTTRDVPALADYWRRIGLGVDEQITPPALSRNLEYTASYPGYEFSAQAPGDGIIRRLDGPAATAENRWSGNRGGYEDPRAAALLLRYRSSLTERDKLDAMKAISDFIAAELPILPTYRAADGVGVRAGIKALEDHMGGDVAGVGYGTFTRNAFLWDVP
jgi:peptide/nickel transport system substrate-binding protein